MSAALSAEQARAKLAGLSGWELAADAKSIGRAFSFDSYAAGLAFVNAVAAVAQKENHHPDIELLYKKVKVVFSTHDVDGLSERDFSCAAKVSGLKA